MSGIGHAIVGIDPGATFGIAIIGLDGRKRHTASTTGGFPDAARLIEEGCTPSLVACDTNPAPEAALRLASYFSCRLYFPRESIREWEKNAIARGAGIADSHQRDAYCAAVYAYRAHANKLRQIDALDGLAEEEKSRVKHLLLRGVRVQDAFLLLREPEERDARGRGAGEHAREGSARAPAAVASPSELKLRLETLARQNTNLRMANERLETEKAALSSRLRLLENGVRQTLLRESEYRRLRHRLSQSLAKLSQTGRMAGARHGQKKPENKGQQAQVGRHGQTADSGGTARHGGGAFAPTGEKNRHSEGINSLIEPNVDLERLVEEYRKSRKNLM